MNLGMFRRAVRRLRYMHDLPAYRTFLQHLDVHGDVWRAPQAEVASWWELRQSAKIHIEVTGNRVLHVSCPLDRCVIEVDGRDLLIPPFELPVPATVPAAPLSISYRCTREHSRFADEVLGHLGYSHVTPAPGEVKATIPEQELTPVLETLRRSALRSSRFDVQDLETLRSLVRAAHHRNGIPDIRLWPLPHRGGRPYRVAVSPRYDVDRAIINMPAIHELERRHGLRSTAYLRTAGLFYGAPEIRRYRGSSEDMEVALHGEFVTTAKEHGIDETAAARVEKAMLEDLLGREVMGVCMHGGELRTNTTPRTRDAIESAEFRYETMYRNDYYLPLHLPHENGVRKTLSIGQHFADITVPPGPGFSDDLAGVFIKRLSAAAAQAGVFVPVMHPLYFNLGHYLRQPANLRRMAAFVPKFVMAAARMRKDQQYSNPT